MLTRTAVALVVAAVPFQAPHAATVTSWDVVKDFSITRNPNGPWRYSGNHNVLHYTILPPAGDEGTETWNDEMGIPDGTYVVRNVTGQVIYTNGGAVALLPDHLDMDPQSGITNIFWEAPMSGRFTLSGDFLGLNQYEGSHYVHIDVLGRPARLLTALVTTYLRKVPFSYTLDLKKGDTINFTVQAGSALYSLSTGIAAEIQLVQ